MNPNRDTTTQKPCRDGTWTKEEESYVEELTRGFHGGWLQISEGSSLRAYLAKCLNCVAKRVSKKFENTGYDGRKRFQKSKILTEEEIMALRENLQVLKERYEESVRELAKKEGRQIKMILTGTTLTGATMRDPTEPEVHPAAAAPTEPPQQPVSQVSQFMASLSTPDLTALLAIISEQKGKASKPQPPKIAPPLAATATPAPSANPGVATADIQSILACISEAPTRALAPVRSATPAPATDIQGLLACISDQKRKPLIPQAPTRASAPARSATPAPATGIQGLLAAALVPQQATAVPDIQGLLAIIGKKPGLLTTPVVAQPAASNVAGAPWASPVNSTAPSNPLIQLLLGQGLPGVDAAAIANLLGQLQQVASAPSAASTWSSMAPSAQTSFSLAPAQSQPNGTLTDTLKRALQAEDLQSPQNTGTLTDLLKRALGGQGEQSNKRPKFHESRRAGSSPEVRSDGSEGISGR